MYGNWAVKIYYRGAHGVFRRGLCGQMVATKFGVVGNFSFDINCDISFLLVWYFLSIDIIRHD